MPVDQDQVVIATQDFHGSLRVPCSLDRLRLVDDIAHADDADRRVGQAYEMVEGGKELPAEAAGRVVREEDIGPE